MRFAQKKILTAGDMSASSVVSAGIDFNQIALASVQAIFTGSPVGVLTLEISNDIVVIDPTVVNQAALVTNWITYTGSSVSVSAAGSFMYNILEPGYRWMRLKYTKTSGSGSLDVTYASKGV